MSDVYDRLPIEGEPPPYRVAERREWITCDEPVCEGLAVLVRTSITNAEQRRLNDAHDEIAGPQTEAWLKAAPEDRDYTQSPRSRERQLLAPYVIEWNAIGVTADGDEQRLPPPSVAGAEVFDLISAAEYEWISKVVLIGYLATGKAETSRTRRGNSGSGFGPQIVPDAT